MRRGEVGARAHRGHQQRDERSTTAKSSDHDGGNAARPRPRRRRRRPARSRRASPPSRGSANGDAPRSPGSAEVAHRSGEALVGHEVRQQHPPAPRQVREVRRKRRAVHEEAQAHDEGRGHGARSRANPPRSSWAAISCAMPENDSTDSAMPCDRGHAGGDGRRRPSRSRTGWCRSVPGSPRGCPRGILLSGGRSTSPFVTLRATAGNTESTEVSRRTRRKP